jgi:phosphate:Na+ symporter
MLRAIIIPFVSDEKFIRREKLYPEEITLLIGLVPRQDETYPELSLLEGVDRRETTIDNMEEELKTYLLKILRQELSDEQARQANGIILLANKTELVADIAHRNFVPLIAKKQKLLHDFSLKGKQEMMIFHHRSCALIRLLIKLILSQDHDQARQIAHEIRVKRSECEKLKMEYFSEHLKRVSAGEEESVETDEVHMELINVLHDINKHTDDIAKTVLETWLTPAKSKKEAQKK